MLEILKYWTKRLICCVIVQFFRILFASLYVDSLLVSYFQYLHSYMFTFFNYIRLSNFVDIFFVWTNFRVILFLHVVSWYNATFSKISNRYRNAFTCKAKNSAKLRLRFGDAPDTKYMFWHMEIGWYINVKICCHFRVFNVIQCWDIAYCH
jgi:hypothetical protein